WAARLGPGSSRAVAPDPPVAVAVAAGYVLSLALAAVRRARAWRRALALRSSALETPLPEAAGRVVEQCRLRLGLGPVAVRLSTGVASPVTLGAGRPVILLPGGLVASLGHVQLVAALGHGMAHVRRREFARNAA